MKKWFENMFGNNEKSDGKRQPKTPAPPKTPVPPKKGAAKAQPAKQQTKVDQKNKPKPEDKKKAPKDNKTPQKKDNKKEIKKEVKKEDKSENKKKPKKERKTISLESVFNSKKLVAGVHFGSRLSAFNGSPPGHNIYDVSAYFIFCAQHNKLAINAEEKTNYSWLPFVSLPASRTWSDGALDGANIILSGGEPNAFLALKEKEVIAESRCLQLFRLQLPQTQKFNIRLIYYIKLEPKPDFKCCADTKRLRWISLEDVKGSKVDNLWGPEVVQFSRSLSDSVNLIINEFSLDDAFMYVPRDPPRNLEEMMLKSANFTEKDVERLYSDFIEHCFPSFFMTQTSFKDYMSKYGFEKSDRKLELLFKAFNFHKNNFLTFHELLLGLTSIDPNTFNGQSRIKFVFKYFDVDGDGHLNEKEFTSLVREINPKDKDSEIKRKVKENMTAIIGEKEGTQKNEIPISFDDFFKAVGAHKFRGTSNLCRSNQPIIQQISRSMASRGLKKTSEKSSLGSIIADKKYKGICQSCKEKRYEFAIHKVRINADGRCCDPSPLPELNQMTRQESKEFLTSEKRDSKEHIDSVKSSPSAIGITGFTRERFSTEIVWNPKSVANHLIDLIRDFNTRKGSHQDNKGVMDGQSERGPFVKKLKELCAEVEKIVAQEERCVKVSSPAFVIGDIHGNIEDMFTMEKVLWKSIPIVSASYVFLGDYVDRGKWGLECALYLMCLKLLAPNKIVLLRGNHEVRELQKNYTYRKECLHKYGESLGEEVFEITNKVFDKLPFCAVIDDAIFCAHGGIPASTRQIEKINEAKVDLRDPERESPPAWEILWSDPIAPQQFAEAADLLKVRVDTARGYLSNTKRGTAFLFGEEAANTFLQTNGLTHIIRAHEVPAQGFTFHFGNKCTTVFSSSHYCGNNNEAAAIHIDNEKLRIIRLDTVNNAPASD